MAKTKLELSWIASLKQWRKRLKGKTYYLGTGAGKTDVESYRLAMAKWQAIQEAQRGSQLQSALDNWRAQNAERLGLTVADTATDNTTKPNAKGLSADYWQNKKHFGQQGSNKAATTATAISAHIDNYISAQEARWLHGQKFPNAPRAERISPQRFISYRFHANLLKKIWSDAPLPSTEADLAQLMIVFRNSQKVLLTEGKIAEGSFNERIKTLRHFVGYLYDNYLVPSLPRRVGEICARHTVISSARALDVKTIRQLFSAASPRLKTYIALGLNCGFYAVDINALKRADIHGDYLECNRHKTGVPTRFRLWAITKRLLAENMNGDNEGNALVARDGGALLRIEPNDGNQRWSEIDNDLAALKKRLKVKGVSFSNFRDTSSTKVESINPQLTDIFDGHKDGRMARFYVDKSKVDTVEMFKPLDDALGQLEKFYGLSLDAPTTPIAAH